MVSAVAPLVSVILPIYNGEKYLVDCINSILLQTFNDFELIVVNDGSTDSSEEIVQSFHDYRIRYYYQLNSGLSKTLNFAIKKSRTNFICRIDQDDLMLADRIFEQYRFLSNNPQVVGCGSWARVIGEDGLFIKKHKYPTNHNDITFYLNFNNPFAHSSIMLRRSIFESVGYYSTSDNQPPEDFELWSRISKSSIMCNIPKFLVSYRMNSGGMSQTKSQTISKNAYKIAVENLGWYTNGCLNKIDVELISGLYWGFKKQVGLTEYFKAYVRFWKCLVNLKKGFSNLMFLYFFLLIVYRMKFKWK